MSNSGTSDIDPLEIKQRNLSRNSSGHNFSQEGPIQVHIISRSLKLNIESSREIQMVITFHMEIRFKHITYGDARNSITEMLMREI